MMVFLSIAWAAAFRTFGSVIASMSFKKIMPMSDTGWATPVSLPPPLRRSNSS